MLKTSKELQIQFNVMKAKVDARIAQPVEVPEPKKGTDGYYPFIGETLPPFPGAPENEDANSRFRCWFSVRAWGQHMTLDVKSHVLTLQVLSTQRARPFRLWRKSPLHLKVTAIGSLLRLSRIYAVDLAQRRRVRTG